MGCNVQTEKCTDRAGSVNFHKLSTPVSSEPRLELEHGGPQKTLAPTVLLSKNSSSLLFWDLMQTAFVCHFHRVFSPLIYCKMHQR